MKTRILITTMMAAFFISSAAFAQNPTLENKRPDKKTMVMKHGERQHYRDNSFLTDEQKEAVKKIKLETAKEVKPFKNELRELRAHQQTLATAEKADMKAIYKNIDKMSGVKAEISKIMAKQRQEVRSLLTNEQRLKMDQRMDRRQRGERPMMKNRMGNRDRSAFGRGA